MNATSADGAENRTAIVTGAARRIGAAIARHLHRRGLNVLIHYRESAAPAETLVAELIRARPDSAALVQADLWIKPATRTGGR